MLEGGKGRITRVLEVKPLRVGGREERDKLKTLN